MIRSRTLLALLGTVSACACSGLLGVSLALADVEDKRFAVKADGTLDFEVRDTTRREVFNQLFAGTGIEIRWVAPSFADERLAGKFTGTPAAVMRQLLSQTNFVVVHGADTSRVIRLVVVGPAKGDQSFAGLAALAAAIKPVAIAKEPKPETIGGDPVRPQAPQPTVKPRVAEAAPPAAEPPKTSSAEAPVSSPENPAAPDQPQSADATPAKPASAEALAAPLPPPKPSAPEGTPVRPENAEATSKPQLAGTALIPAELPKVSSLAAPAASPDGQKPAEPVAAENRPGALAALGDVDQQGTNAMGILTPPPEGAKAPMLVLTEGNTAPPLVAPAEGLMALPLSPPPPGAAPPELRPAPSGAPDNK